MMADITAPKSDAKKRIDPANTHLSKEVAEHYEVVNWHGGHEQNFGRYGIVNLKTMTITRADALVRQKFSKLRKK